MTRGKMIYKRGSKIIFCGHCGKPFPSYSERDRTITKHFTEECTNPPSWIVKVDDEKK